MHSTTSPVRPVASSPQDPGAAPVAGPEARAGVPRTPRVVMLIAVLSVYLGYLLLVAAGGPLVSRPMGQVTTLAILAGIAVLPAIWILTGLYVGWANRTRGSTEGPPGERPDR